MSSIIRLIAAQAKMHPEKPALLLSDRALTYRMLDAYASSAAERIGRAGIGRDRPVGIDIASPSHHMAVCLALLKLGIASVSLNANLLGAAADAGVADVLADRPQSAPGLRQHLVKNDWFGQRIDAYDRLPDRSFQPNQIARVFFSSGSTGKPKPIGLTEDKLFARISDRMWKFGAQPWDRSLCMPGLTTEAGFTYSVFGLCLGRTISFAETAEDALQLLSIFGLEQIRASPTQLRGLVTLLKEKFVPLPRLSSVHSGGGWLSYDLLKSVSALLCPTVIDSYGSTEAGTAAIAGGNLLRERENSPPAYFPLVEIQCVSRDLTPLERGEEGAIRIRSRSLGRPYDGNLFPEPDDEHWFYPGDSGYLNDDGLLVLAGRMDNVINIGGFKLSPELIEDHLISHPKIADAAIVKTELRDGSPPRLLVAVVADEGLMSAAQIREWCARAFSDVEIGTIARVASIPRTEFGKVAREALSASLGRP